MTRRYRSREVVAKDTINFWRRLCAHSEAPAISRSIDQLADELNMARNDVDAALRLFRSLGMVELKLAYEFQKTMPTQHIKVEVETGANTLIKYFAKGGSLYAHQDAPPSRKPAAPVTDGVAIRTDEKEQPVEAIAGPDAPKPFDTPAMRELRKDEPAALVAAARQYANRQDAVFSKFDELEKLGIKIDRTKAMQAVKLERDDELEGIVKVLPHIDQLAAQAKQAGEWRSEVLAMREANRSLRNDLQRQTEANKRLSESNARLVVGQGTTPAAHQA